MPSHHSGGIQVLMGDGSVRHVGPGLAEIVRDITSNSKPGSIGDVVLAAADVSGWKVIRPGELSWAWLVRRPRPPSGNEPQGIIAILIGLLQPASSPGLSPSEQHALRGLRANLAPGARLHLIAGHKFTLQQHSPAADPYNLGFSGGVFVQT